MNRITQFFVALFRRRGLNAAQVAWVDEHLAPAERALFWQMAPSDQRHAVAVSMKAAAMARTMGLDERERLLLLRAGLLHDIGKARGEIGLVARAWVVIVRALAPALASQWSRRAREELLGGGPASFGVRMRRAFYIDEVHPLRGAAMAAWWGVEGDVVELIRRHHQRPGDSLGEALAAADRSS